MENPGKVLETGCGSTGMYYECVAWSCESVWCLIDV